VRVHSYRKLDIREMSLPALEDKLDGYTLLVDRLPDPDWLAEIEMSVIETGITLHFIKNDPVTGKVSFRELCGPVGTFPGPRRVRTLGYQRIDHDWDPDFQDEDPDEVLVWEGMARP